MKINLECYGVLQQMCGSERQLNLAGDTAPVAQVLKALAEAIPDAAPHMEHTACAVGEDLVGRDYQVRDGQTLALLPPVSGG
jgi:molybdopterin converting factor small subunit